MRRITSKEIALSFETTPQITFEVTEGCNLRCKYCGYGELYEASAHRHNRTLTKQKALGFLEYYRAKVQASKCCHDGRELFLSFFGGEPLLNFSLIEQVVDWAKISSIQDFRVVKFSMTTNGLLLHRYRDFLVENGFNLLISLDGDERASSYRKFPDGSSSFSQVKRNVDELKFRHPDYFEEHVKFNSVLNDRSSVESIIDFVKQEYGKIPSISAINPIGVSQ